MIWLSLIIIGFLSLVRNQLEKYLGLSIDWFIFYHIIVLLLGILALIKIFISGNFVIKKRELPFIIIIIVFLLAGTLYFENNIFITCWGIFEYLYIFLWSYFLSYMYPAKQYIKLVYNSFCIFVILIVGIAIYQEIEYVLNKFGVIPFMLFSRHPEEAFRLGFLRPPSLVGSPTEWGNVALIYLFIELYRKNFKLSIKSWIIILALIISMTRAVYLSTLAAITFMILFNKKNLFADIYDRVEKFRLKMELKKMRVKFLILVLIISGILFAIFVYSMKKRIDFIEGEGHLRGYGFVIAKSIENKITGLGPGMFGSYVSFKTKTPYLEKYYSYILSGVERIKTIDSYWIQVFIETGIAGIILNFFLFYFFYKIMLNNFKVIDRKEIILKPIAFSCMLVPIVYVVVGIGNSPFIMPSFIIWTSLLCGMVWGTARRYKKEKML